MPIIGNTELVITPLSGQTAPFLSASLTPFAVRNLTQTLEPIIGASGSGGSALGTWVRRDINGNLMNLAPPQMRKYQSEVSCRDMLPPGLDDAWIGAVVEVKCAAELLYAPGGSPFRPVVTGSQYTDQDGVGHYKPILIMMILGISQSLEEWEAFYSWKLSMAEV
jgi:hypothetical protein